MASNRQKKLIDTTGEELCSQTVQRCSHHLHTHKKGDNTLYKANSDSVQISVLHGQQARSTGVLGVRAVPDTFRGGAVTCVRRSNNKSRSHSQTRLNFFD